MQTALNVQINPEWNIAQVHRYQVFFSEVQIDKINLELPGVQCIQHTIE